MIKNPIISGFNPDPCICRKGDDYYIACSTFEWMPGIPIYHSKDLKNWEHLTNVINDDEKVDLKKLPSAKGIWAPCLTYCEEDDLFYVVYGVMNSMNARYFDVDNYLISSKNIEGPWSEPIYLHSAGFDASILHDGDGKKYIVSLLWETRDGYEKPGPICICEYDPIKKEIKDYPKPIFTGATERGCIEAPHLYKKNGQYCLMCAEGGTGYYHCATFAHSNSPFGPYVEFENNPIITSYKENNNERSDTDHLKPHYYASGVYLQKSGHASFIDLPNGETYAVHLCSRPLMPEKACVLGRETAIQKMKWSSDGCLRMADGDNIAKEYTDEPNLPEFAAKKDPIIDNFDEEKIGNFYIAPRVMPNSFAKINNGHITLTGKESLSSVNRVSLLARRLESINSVAECEISFLPDVYRHTAGLAVYYDNMNYAYLRVYYSDKLKSPALGIVRVDNGIKTDIMPEYLINPFELKLKVNIKNKTIFFEYKEKGNNNFKRIGKEFETAKFSDEYSSFGEFTGTMIGIACTDEIFKRKTADFNYFSLKSL